MTVPYADSFSAALLQWHGSLYRAVFKEILAFYAAYYLVMVAQWMLLSDSEKVQFNKLCAYLERGSTNIPLTFLLGFFVTAVAVRWWSQFNLISWPDRLMCVVATTLGEAHDEAARRTIARWSALQAAIAWRVMSIRTRARFPTDAHLVRCGLMTPQECQTYAAIEAPYGKWFIPSFWIGNLLRRLHKAGHIDSYQLKIIVKELLPYSDAFGLLQLYDWIHIPLVYTQVVAIATYGYFLLCLIGRQPQLDEASLRTNVTLYVPIFTTLQMMFYVGWLKVGQYLMHPFGDDEDDFDLNWIFDRNLQTAYLMADNCLVNSSRMPQTLCDDPFLYTTFNRIQLPHTRASARIRDIEPKDNLAHFNVSLQDQELVEDEDSFSKHNTRWHLLKSRIIRETKKKQDRANILEAQDRLVQHLPLNAVST